MSSSEAFHGFLHNKRILASLPDLDPYSNPNPHPVVGRRARRQASDTTASMEPSSIMHASGTARAAAIARIAIDAAAAGEASADKRQSLRSRAPSAAERLSSSLGSRYCPSALQPGQRFGHD